MYISSDEEIIREPDEERRKFLIDRFEEARVKIPLRTSEPDTESSPSSSSHSEYPEPLSVVDEFDFLTKEQRAEAMEEQRRRDEQNESLRLAKRLHQQELQRKWESDCAEAESQKLAQEIAENELRREKLKANPILAQEKILQALIRENHPPQRPIQRPDEDSDLEWCNKKLHYRISDAKITNISVKGYTYAGGVVKVYTTISRGGMKEATDQAFALKYLGFSEWLEVREALQRSKSKFKGVVENILNELLKRMSLHYEVPPLPEKTRKGKAKILDDDSDPSFKNESEIKFDYNSVLGHLEIPDVSMLDTSLPEARQFYEHEIVSQPEAGLVFLDNNGFLKFFRNKEVHKAPTEMLRLMCYVCWAQDVPTRLQKSIYEKELQRRGVEF